MKYLITTLEGMEELVVQEAQAHSLSASILTRSRVVAEGDVQQFLKETKLSIRILEVLSQLKSDNIDTILSSKVEGAYKTVICDREGTHEFTSQMVRDGFMKQMNRDLSSDKTLFIDIVDEFVTIGILLTPKRLSTRPYMVRINTKSVPPLVAAAAVAFSDFNKDEGLADPFCRDGIVLIEAARQGHSKVFGVDIENNVRNARINTLMAEVNVQLSEGFMESMPAVPNVITRPFEFFVRMNPEKVQSKLTKMFNLLRERSVERVTLIMSSTGNVEDAAKEAKFQLISKHVIKSGEMTWFILLFS